MNIVSFEELSKDDRELILAARETAFSRAYAPYSGFAVGAAARGVDKQRYLGANLENAAYGVVMCAEVSALTAANTAGAFGTLEVIAVVGFSFWPKPRLSEVVTPCGRCRQLIFEASQLAEGAARTDREREEADITVFACSGDLKNILQYKISELLPTGFGPKTLGVTNPPNPESAGMEPPTS
jgi:cytidine deaminase